MNEKFHTYLKKAGDETRLSADERTRMRSVLSAYMAMKPVRTGIPAAPAWNTYLFLPQRQFATAFVLVLFIGSGGISYAAQGALPGDTLYPVKVNVNEPVEGALALSSSAKAEWAMRVAGERLEEAATLAATGHLDAVTQEDLQKNFESHASLAIQHIDEETDASADVGARSAVQFEAQLSEYQRVLSEVGTQDSARNTLAVAIRTQLDAVTSVRAHAEARSSGGTSSSGTAIAAGRMREAAKRQLSDSRDLARSAASSLASSSADAIALELEGASMRISDGDTLLGKDSAPEALGVFQGALSAAEKLGVFLQTSSAIHKRTGRVISEPKEHAKSSSEGKGDNSSLTEAPRPASASVSATMMVTATTSDARVDTSDSGDQPRDDGKKSGKDDEETILPSLQLPAPSSLFQ